MDEINSRLVVRDDYRVDYVYTEVTRKQWELQTPSGRTSLPNDVHKVTIRKEKITVGGQSHNYSRNPNTNIVNKNGYGSFIFIENKGVKTAIPNNTEVVIDNEEIIMERQPRSGYSLELMWN